MTNKPPKFPFIPPIEIVMPTERFPPVGHCIYCGTYSTKLELEHILPFGIAGDALLLPKASCRTCAHITGTIEQACLRHMWWPFRAKIGAPTSKPNDRPETFTLRRVVRQPNGEFLPAGTSQVSTEEYPLSYVALKLQPPGILEGRPPTTNLEGEIWIRCDEQDFKKYAPNDQDGFFMGPVNPTNFCRFLAKIALGYATAKIGHKNFRPLVRELIRGKSDTPNFWVGGNVDIPLPPANPA